MARGPKFSQRSTLLAATSTVPNRHSRGIDNIATSSTGRHNHTIASVCHAPKAGRNPAGYPMVGQLEARRPGIVGEPPGQGSGPQTQARPRGNVRTRGLVEADFGVIRRRAFRNEDRLPYMIVTIARCLPVRLALA